MKKLIKKRYAFVFVLILFIVSLSSKDGILFIFKLKKEIAALKNEIEELNTANLDYKNKISEVKKSSRLLEIYARTRLGMVKNDEIVYEIKE